jgi:hypothetical protein
LTVFDRAAILRLNPGPRGPIRAAVFAFRAGMMGRLTTC